MKLRFLAALLLSAASAAAQPAPGRMEPGEGSFVFTPETTLAADEALLPLAEYAAEYLGCEVRQELTGASTVVLTLEPGPETEAYRLEIAPEYIRIGATSYGGAFNGLQALFRLLPPGIYARRGPAAGTTLACGRIEDAPRYAYRGMMLDVTRTWIDASKVKRYIDLLSYHNINKLHIHLADDEGWRIEIRSHPELAEIGGFRGGDSPVVPVYGKWSEKYGGYYTQAEMRELIDYAARRNIEIIPEIDLPGHSRCIGSVHPEIRCDYPADTAATAGTDYRSAWCVAREENYALLEDILGEICDLFPSEYIHIGGDEVEVSEWERCPRCRAMMKRLGIRNAHRLQDRFMDRLAAMLEARGKRPAVWDEAAASGKFTRASRVHGWRSVKSCKEATAKGYRTVAMPSQWFYFDMRQSPREEGHSWAAIFDARKTYGFDLAAEGFSAEQMRRIEGFEGAFWTEIYASHDPESCEYMDRLCFPRICALSRIAWSGNAEGWESYYKELTEEHYDRLAAMGIEFRLFPPQLTYENGVFTATADDGAELFYMLDDGTPKRYTKPLRTSEPHRYRFFSQYGPGRSPHVADKSYYRTIAPALTITSSMPQSGRAPYERAAGYRSASRTLRTCREGDWLLYTFEKPVNCREIYLQTGHAQLPKTQITTGYAEISYDGERFERAGELENGSIVLHPEQRIKAVRLVATCHGNDTPYVTIQPPQIKPRL
ncbi:MAG: beta-N-acetylhexosaminidase [Bacteroides cellulosilyticus]|nr:beta-N-acetylhexosaminidase [Bacteroides cellulosilyticus]